MIDFLLYIVSAGSAWFIDFAVYFSNRTDAVEFLSYISVLAGIAFILWLIIYASRRLGGRNA